MLYPESLIKRDFENKRKANKKRIEKSMSEWKEYKLGDLYDVHNGLSKGRKFFGSGYPFLSFKTVFNNYFLPPKLSELVQANEKEQKGYNIKRGDVFVTRTSETPEELGMSSVALKDYPFATYNGFTKRLRPKDMSLVCPEFIGYYLRSPKFRALFYGLASSMSTRASLVNGDLLGMSVFLPSFETQERIASLLSSLDDKISVNKKICENLEAQAQALFKHWFIDFAPFKDGKFVESELGMIPEGWRVGTLGEYVDNLNGYSYKGNELQPSTTAMVTIKNFVRGGGFKIEGFKEIVVSKKIKEYQYISLFDVLVAHTDLTQKAEVVGNPAIILSTGDYDKLVMSMDLTKVVPKDARITTPLLHSILSTRKFKEHALGYVNGTTVLHMNKKAVPEYCFAIPKNLDILKGLTAILDNIYRMMSEIYAENLRLSTLRDTLLPRLMSGQIKL